MSKTKPWLSTRAPRVDKYEGKTCSARDCDRECRALSRFCQRHAAQHYRTRNPLGRIPKRKETAPYKRAATYALNTWHLGDHPAVKAAEDSLLAMIRAHERFDPPYRAHFWRLNHEGATGRELLLAALSVYGLRELGLARAFGGGGVDDAVFFAALGSRFLRVKGMGVTVSRTGKEDQARVSGLVCEAVGRAVAERLGALPILFWCKYEELAKAERTAGQAGQAVQEALEQHPL